MTTTSRKKVTPRKTTPSKRKVSHRTKLEALFALYAAGKLANKYITTPLSKLAEYGDRKTSKK